MEPTVIFREYIPDDERYIFSTMLRDLRDSDSSPLPDDIYYTAQRANLVRLLSSKSVSVKVAVPSDNQHEILGYIITQRVKENTILWWIQVRKGALRGKGLARRMLELHPQETLVPAFKTRDLETRLKMRADGRRVRALCKSQPLAE